MPLHLLPKPEPKPVDLLDLLYGDGTFDEVVKMCSAINPQPDDHRTQVWTYRDDDLVVRLEIVWGHIGGAKLHCKPEEIFWALLSTVCGNNQVELDSQTYGRVVSELVPVFKARGVKRIIAQPADEPSKQRLMAGAAFEDQGDGRIIWTL